MMKRLRYEKYNNSDSVITIDLHNGYSVIAISGFNADAYNYTTSLFLKENSIDDWKLIEDAENIEFNANKSTINSAILKYVSNHLEEGFFDYYIQRYEYEIKCFDKGSEYFDSERLGDANAS